MREIKLRAWDKDMERWVAHSSQVRIEVNNPRVYHLHENGMYVECDDIEIMQYTGLKDKNGVEIYEGDMLEVDWSDKRYPVHTIGPVIWDNYEANWNLGEGGSPMDDAKNHMRIVGNIYDNSDIIQS